MEELIGACAARVVSLLEKEGQMNVLLVPESLGERSVVVYQALGWLARDYRVRYLRKGPHTYVSLNETEKNPGHAGR